MSAPDHAPTLLVLDTSTEQLHLGLLAGGRSIVRREAGGAQSSARLLPALQAMLAEAGIAWAELDAIGFGRGPGAFTGVRTACAVTQGLAEALGKPVLALDTLMAVAEDARGRGAGPLLRVAIDARMGQAYSAAYRVADDGAWITLDAPALHEPAALAAAVDPGFAVAGNSLHAHAPAWQGLGGRRDADAEPRADALLRLALQRWRAGERLDPAAALPLYVRDQVALTTAERDAVRLAKEAAA
jgi:tRNA threonylcarbamoyladenosine biosynthesis protein TsaB